MFVGIATVLEVAARELAMEARKRVDRRKPRSGRGATLRPSSETRLWNVLATVVKPHLKRRGARANLARELGVHRARIGEYFDKQTSMPDAERTLLLLSWLGHRLDEAASVAPNH